MLFVGHCALFLTTCDSMIKMPYTVIGFVLLSIVILATSCMDDNFYEGDDISLRFEVDTLRFDTVFTTVGTITRSVKVFNDLDERINIESITLADPEGPFRLNSQGFNSLPIQDIVIQPNDSIYIFVEATIDPDAPVSISPFILEEQILLTTTNEQSIQIEAFGQNANYLENARTGSFSLLSCDFEEVTWDDPKPYVIYGSLLIDSCTLVLPAGTEIYVHGGIANNALGVYNDGLIVVGNNGTIQSNGTAELPVRIQTDRLEESFQDDPGQWAGILLTSDNENRFDHTDIFHSIVGIRVDSAANAEIHNCEIAFNSGNALLGVHSTIHATNSLFHSSLSHGVNLVHGGDYQLEYCTVYNESSQTHALNMNNFLCLDQFCQQALKNPLNGIFRNCIFGGFNSDEVWLDDIDPDDNNDLQYFFDHCVFRIDELIDPNLFPNFFENVSNSINYDANDTLFLDVDSLFFQLDTMSIARDVATPISALPLDKVDFIRSTSSPDVGCFEFVD